METSNKSTGETLFDLTLYAEVIHANPSQPLAADKENTTRDTCGHGYEMPLADYDPDTQSWRMFGDTYLWGDCPLLESLPPSGMTQNGVLYLQPAWVPITDATASSLWPTPTAHPDNSNVNGKFKNPTLGDAVRMWPTPTASDWKPRGPNSKQQGLPEVVKTRGNLWPTPRAALGDTRNHTVYERSLDKPQNLENRVGAADPSTIGGKLNPTWVEWLMGFPPGWTDLED